MECQKDLESMKKGASCNENQGENLLNDNFWGKSITTLSPSISGTKCHRDKPIIYRNRGSIGLCCAYKIGPYRIDNTQNRGHHHGTSLPCPSMRVPTLDPEYTMHAVPNVLLATLN